MSEEGILKKLEEMEIEILRLTKRVSVLEGHLNISPDDYKDIMISDVPYFNLQDQGITPFCDHVKQLQERSARSEYEEQKEKLKNELYKKGLMHTKDIMVIFGFKHYEQAKRLMRKLADEDKRFLYENAHGKTYRIRYVNNVRTNSGLNSMCAQN